MKSVINYPVKVFATGFVVLVFTSLLLCYVRNICEASLLGLMPEDARTISKSPFKLVPERFENDPNVECHSIVSARIGDAFSLGIFDYFQARIPGGRLSNIYYFVNEKDNMYFDRKSGLIVLNFHEEIVMPDRRRAIRQAQRYVGPEGMSVAAGDGLGRFVEPIVARDWFFRVQKEKRGLIIYDKRLRRFFKVDFDKGQVTKGPELARDYNHCRPIQIGRLKKSFLNSSFSLNWEPPKIKINKEDMDGRVYSSNYELVIPHAFGYEAGPYIVVLDESGLIYMLDKEGLEFVKIDGLVMPFGQLPGPGSYFGHGNLARPKDLLDYEVLPLSLTTHIFGENPEVRKEFFGEPSVPDVPPPSRIEREYLGMITASLSRDGTALALDIFDEKGKRVESGDSSFTKLAVGHTINHRSGKGTFFEPPWSSTYTTIKYLAENLHPPILSLGSYYTAYSFDAAEGHRGLFLLPNSFIAKWGRVRSGNFVERLLFALWMILPSIIFSILLARRVNKDAVIIGLSDRTRSYWVLETVGFGLAGYITYRLMRPKITLVTCQSCGLMRRPDMNKCHRCKSAWFVPELTPPTWRVLDGVDQTVEVERTDKDSIGPVESADDTEEAATE
ncbi:MAG: hypothetical protein JW837_07180 [Sedimentisphaerales bacterium]|nr:hypothetical protein [Sedimentisphaerales bacterium]